MELISNEVMEVKCNHCGGIHRTENMKDFKESNTYPPHACFMCLDCKQMARVDAPEMPKRLFSYLVNKITQERFGNIDQRVFDRMNDI